MTWETWPRPGGKLCPCPGGPAGSSISQIGAGMAPPPAKHWGSLLQYCQRGAILQLLSNSDFVRNLGLSADILDEAGLPQPVLWNRNYFLRFRFRLLKSYDSGSDFEKVTVPVPTFDKLQFLFRFWLLTSYGSGSGSISRPEKANEKKWKNLAFLASKLHKFHQMYCKMWMKKMLNEENQI